VNKETYLQYRLQKQIIPVAFHYFLEKGGKEVDFHYFAKSLQNFINLNPFGLDWNRLWEYYDKKFTINILEEINSGKIIKIY